MWQRDAAIQKEKEMQQKEKERLRAEAVKAEAELFRKMVTKKENIDLIRNTIKRD